jgi:phytoene desaturase
MKQVHVIGGGFGGLSAAITAAAQGWKVVLYEKQARVGGKANTKMVGGFRFDTGPSLLTLPDIFARLFNQVEKDIADYIPIVPLSPITRYWFSDGTRFASDRLERFIPTLTEHLAVTEAEVRSHFTKLHKIWERTHRIFLEQSLHSLSTYLSRDTLSSLLHIGSIDAMRSMHAANSESFSDPRMVQLLDRYATYNGSDPFQAPATLNMIAHVEHGLGGFGVKNGIYGIIEGLLRLARELDIEVHTNTEVERIICDRKGKVTHLAVGGETIGASSVISDVDVLTLYERLLQDPEAPLATRYRRLPPSSSALVFYWGIDRSFNELGLHNIFFSSDYQKEFAQIHRYGKVPLEPTVYVNIGSKITLEDAPEGQENWFVLINAPPHDGRDWSVELQQTRSHVVNRISSILEIDLEQHIVVEDFWTPETIERDTGSHAGSLYGISSNTTMAAFLRHPNKSKRHHGLYLCGGSVHPGGGMPLATLSGMIAARLLSKEKP